MQYTARIDDIKAAPNRSKLENIRLRIVDACSELGGRLVLRVTETAQAQVDRKHLRAHVFLHRSNRDLAGAAAGNEYVERARLAQRCERGCRKLLAQIVI